MTQAVADEVVDQNALAGGADTDTTQNLDGGEPAGEEGDGGGEGEEGQDEGVVITIGEEPPTSEEAEEQRAPEWVRELRKSNREKDRQIRELQAKVAAPAPATVVQVGEKPTLEGSDYDSDRFEQELTSWHERKRAADEEERKKTEARTAEQRAWQAKLDTYGTQAAALKVRDYEETEAIAKDTLNVTQQGVILQGAENPAIVIYALGKNPKKAKELASITDPVKFAFAVAKLETQLKVTPRKSAPLPESTVRGSAAGASAMNATLAQLEAEADRTGDRSKILAYRKQQRERAGK